jgi:hypothetical protein
MHLGFIRKFSEWIAILFLFIFIFILFITV